MDEQWDKKMDNLNVPDVNVDQHQQSFHVSLMNTRKSAWLGILLIILPFLFLSGAVLRNNIGIESNVLTWFYDWVVDDAPDSDTSILSWLIRLTLVGGPILAMTISLMGILHVHYKKGLKELVISLKLRWINVLLFLFCGMVFTVFFWVLIVENVNHP